MSFSGKITPRRKPADFPLVFRHERTLANWVANSLTGRGTARYLWLEQNGKCLVCRQPLTLDERWHVHHLLGRAFGGDDKPDNLVLLHRNCHRQVHREGLVVEKFASREGRW